MCLGAGAPALWHSLSESERGENSSLTSDSCIIKGKHFFILGRILIPVIDSPEFFVWLAWVSLSEKSYQRVGDLWEQEGRESEPPYFGWLQSELPYPSSTLSLKTSLQTMPLGERPEITLERSEHPLSMEQQNGITLARVQEIVEAAPHG